MIYVLIMIKETVNQSKSSISYIFNDFEGSYFFPQSLTTMLFRIY